MTETCETYADRDWWALARELRTADHCHGTVTRDGELDACGKPPVAIIDARATEDQGFWPACAYHANRWGTYVEWREDPSEEPGRCQVVPLAVLLAAVEQGESLRLQGYRPGAA